MTAIVRGYWDVRPWNENIETRRTKDLSAAENYRRDLNERGCPIVSVTYER